MANIVHPCRVKSFRKAVSTAKNWVLEVPLKNARLTSSRVIRGGAFDEQVQWLMMVDDEKSDQEKSYFLPLLKIL